MGSQTVHFHRFARYVARNQVLAKHKDEAVFAHARVAFPTVVHLAFVFPVVDNPKGIFVELLVDAYAIGLGFLHNGIVPLRHIVDALNDLLHMFGAEAVFRKVGTIIDFLVARVAYDAETVLSAVMLDRLETDADILPTTVEVLVGQG